MQPIISIIEDVVTRLFDIGDLQAKEQSEGLTAEEYAQLEALRRANKW
jgi:uncharacterized protein YnzC (UPF0291/DUF896 family)